MIEVLGEEGTPEHAVAIALAEAISRLWPGIADSPAGTDNIKIAANVKISGYRVSDIDLVLVGRFGRGRRFRPRRHLRDVQGNRVIGKPVTVANLVVAAEVKDHGPGAVEFVGDKVNVRYSRGGPPRWKSASDQNIAQVHALRAYLSDVGAECYVHRCLIMRGLDRAPLAGVIAGQFDGEAFLSALAAESALARKGSSVVLASGNDKRVNNALRAPIFRPVVPSTLDRIRMDRIASQPDRVAQLLPLVGQRMVELRGPGGTGKTVMLLQLAWQSYRQFGKRALVLTYNHALAADIRRLLALMGVPSTAEGGGIAVDTVMSFMYSWFSRLQLFERAEPDFARYDELCRETTEMLEAGAISDNDISAIVAADPDRFDFDQFVVDEAQDWPQAEVDLLKALYASSRICIADGIDQLVRGARARWERGTPSSERHVVSLSRCLRMKRNLAIFANDIARDSGTAVDLVPNEEAGGGRVVVLAGGYERYPRLHDQLLAEARSAGNAEIDFLLCVPPGEVTSEGKAQRHSRIGRYLQARGLMVWDGVDERVRRDFVRSVDSYRVVQYASCRGLEGWVVILDRLDEFWHECFSNRLQRGFDNRTLDEAEAAATRVAWRWVLIALTRPIDTLVITITEFDSVLGQRVKLASQHHPDIVEYYEHDLTDD